VWKGNAFGSDAGEAVAAQDVQHHQLAAGPGCDSAGAPDQGLALRAAGDRDDHPFAGFPGVGDLFLGAIALQGDVDLVGHPQQGQFAERGEVAGAEVVGQRGVDAVRGIDVAVRESSA